MSAPARSRFVAVLGPTNTGKTHLALERMAGHASGMIGFPLRLLARENYDRMIRLKGPGQVALVTGEEKIIPPQARWFLCTVESMPLDRPVDFLAIDEIQMCADPDRGHIFTERLLHARGLHETMVMGAETVRALLRRLVPGVEVIGRPRFSTLRYAGPRKVTRLPPRSAVVAFSAADVYALAELIRRQKGGAAVVLGALSPRTRNAQVGLFQAGEVDYLVATDAIGMGLNLEVNHVAFAELRKFDGRTPRNLTASELGQIAGRAGRHMNDGTFGTTAEVGPLDPELVERIENHRFDKLTSIFWRNGDLRFASIATLVASLNAAPPAPGLMRAREADDIRALNALAAEAEIAVLAVHPDAVRRLWEVCRIPDFAKSGTESHARLLGRIYRHLSEGDGILPVDWIAAQVARLDRTDGDIEALVQRIAMVRTWTYVSYQSGWLAEPRQWQERTRALEDKLSDALHERLQTRFVDQRTSALVKRMKDGGPLAAEVDAKGAVTVEGHVVGRLDGFRFAAEAAESALGARTVSGAALKALRADMHRRLIHFEDQPDDAFAFDEHGRVVWDQAPVARIEAGAHVLTPRIEPLASDLLEPADRERIQRRLGAWLESRLDRHLGPLRALVAASLAGPARGLAYQLGEALGSLPRRQAEEQIDALSREDRQQLRKLGAVIGRESVYLPALLKPEAVRLIGVLWAVGRGIAPPAPPVPGRVALSVTPEIPEDYYAAIGHRVIGERAIRIDILERIAEAAWNASKEGAFALTPELMSLAGSSAEDTAAMLRALGYRKQEDGRHRRGAKVFGKKPAPRQPIAEHSPFAKLKERFAP